MREALRVDPGDAVPIWRQIEEGLRRMVASRALPPGSPVPSVRDMARELRVNPATVSKAYQRLVDAGILAVKRGEGTFVAEGAPASLVVWDCDPLDDARCYQRPAWVVVAGRVVEGRTIQSARPFL